ncbi:sensor histidine kinase [Nonomuraea cavernae]|nr:ATP-binding protein [Nonomuraea cavernae]MCA2186675.1 histidine kinase [Nonomuraea cavernae]
MPAGGAAHQAAERLEARRAQIMETYQRELELKGSLLVRDPHARGQLLRHAELILGDVINSLRAGSVQVDEGYRLLALDIGSSRASRGVQPSESLTAASALFEAIVLETVTEVHGSVEALRLAVLALHRSLMLRITAASASYSGYLLGKLHDAHLDERNRIARELHDRVGSALSIAHRQLELYDVYRAGEPVKAANRAGRAQEALKQSMLSLRAVTSDLKMDDVPQSLEKALLGYVDTVADHGPEISLGINGDETWAPPTVRDESFLVIREAVRNALSHGAPRRILVTVDIAPHELRAMVDDDGSGFTDTDLAASDGIGLASIRERVDLLGGTVTLFSRPGAGTHVEMAIPLPGHRDAPSQ